MKHSSTRGNLSSRTEQGARSLLSLLLSGAQQRQLKACEFDSLR